ncbi:hypothetical protein R1sor_005162 [Riccia sorocarpa]|uniref:Uncharacterized protein n=1 Tax=Riccia sorocarpa TaxID=122646 RepID=A0ABD3HN23_9MARC
MPGLRFIDIGANLADGMFRGLYHGKQQHPGDMSAVLKRAWDAGVERIIITGISLHDSREALALADTDGRLYCTVGVHPTRCSEWEESGDPQKHYQELLALAKEGAAKGKVVAIGECGLDYDRLIFCPAEVQKRYFEKQFDLAEATGLPMFLHMRAAAEDFKNIVEKNKNRFRAGCVHSFTGTNEDLQKMLSFPNLYIGINGCSLKTSENLEVMKNIPPGRMMIETDAPYCGIKASHASSKHIQTTWPSKKKEKWNEESLVKDRNEPCQLRQVFEVVAAVVGEKDHVSLARNFYENTCKVFFPHDIDTLANTVLANSASNGS